MLSKYHKHDIRSQLQILDWISNRLFNDSWSIMVNNQLNDNIRYLIS